MGFAVWENGPAQLAITETPERYSVIVFTEDKSNTFAFKPFSSAKALTDSDRPARIGVNPF